MIGKIRKQEEEEICSVLIKGGRIEDGMKEEGRKEGRQTGWNEGKKGGKDGKK